MSRPTSWASSVAQSVAVETAGAIIAGHACEPIWQILQAEILRRQRDGGQVRPEVASAIEALRAAAQAHIALRRMSACGPVSSDLADMAAESMTSTYSSTQDMAGRLHVDPSYARRLAKKAGIQPIGRDRWRTCDVDELEAQRKRNGEHR